MLFVSDSLWPHKLQPASLPPPWDFPGKNIGMGCHYLLQGIFPPHGSNLHVLHVLHWQVNSLTLTHLGSPIVLIAEPNQGDTTEQWMLHWDTKGSKIKWGECWRPCRIFSDCLRSHGNIIGFQKVAHSLIFEGFRPDQWFLTIFLLAPVT